MREPSLEAKYFCSSTNSTCELTKLTPGTQRGLVQLHQERDLGFERHLERVALERAGPGGDHLVGIGEHDLARGQHRIRAGDRHRLFGGRPRRAGLDALVAAKPHAPFTSTRKPKP